MKIDSSLHQIYVLINNVLSDINERNLYDAETSALLLTKAIQNLAEKENENG